MSLAAELTTSQQITKWVLIVVGVLFVIAIVVAAGYWLSAGVRTRWRGRRFADRIRSNMAYDLTATAQTAVLRLGERIDASRMADSHDAAHWQSALDCYQAASYAHDHARGPADQLGAIVLAEMGDAHLSSAVDGATYDDRPRCYFDPRHGRSEKSMRGPGGTPRTVPACKQCRKAKRGTRTAFTVDGEPYYRSGVEPWSSTGYGSVGDLLAAVTQHRWS